VALCLETVIATIRLTREDVDALLRITLPAISRAIFDVRVMLGQPVAEPLKIFPAQRFEW
jgi:hypothetical protein